MPVSPKPLNVGLIGGGRNAFIARVHERAIHFDGTRRIVAAALSSDPQIALQEAEKWPYPIRGYKTYDEMFDDQPKLPADDRLDYVVIVTPNNVHYDPAIKAIQANIPVFIEKPLATSLEEAAKLVRAVKKSNIPFAVAYAYTGFWTSRFARYIIRSGLLGEVRWVDAYYLQGWLAAKIEDFGNPQAAWRTNPKIAGPSGCAADIGIHALMQLRFITGLEVTHLSANLETFVEGRELDDHMTVYCRLNNNAKALIRASQVSIGHKNDLGIEVVCERGALIWRQEEPDCVRIHLLAQPDRVYWRGAVIPGDGFLPKDIPQELLAESKLPAGHMEGFHDAFARLHRCFEADVRKWKAGETVKPDTAKYPTVIDGWVGVAFVATCLKSSKQKSAWVSFPKIP